MIEALQGKKEDLQEFMGKVLWDKVHLELDARTDAFWREWFSDRNSLRFVELLRQAGVE